jgi:hypothetical protein
MPTANAHCERLIGSIRRECLDYVIPLNASHLRRTLREWASHYNGGRTDDSNPVLRAARAARTQYAVHAVKARR